MLRTSVRIVGVPARIRTKNLPNSSQNRYQLKKICPVSRDVSWYRKIDDIRKIFHIDKAIVSMYRTLLMEVLDVHSKILLWWHKYSSVTCAKNKCNSKLKMRNSCEVTVLETSNKLFNIPWWITFNCKAYDLLVTFRFLHYFICAIYGTERGWVLGNPNAVV
jgi:hypothetical protein